MNENKFHRYHEWAKGLFTQLSFQSRNSVENRVRAFTSNWSFSDEESSLMTPIIDFVMKKFQSVERDGIG
jgi:hypothetical protein